MDKTEIWRMIVVCTSNDCKYNDGSRCTRDNIVIFDDGMCGNRKIDG